MFIRVISFYRKWVSPAKPASCRFLPTCSEYAIEALELHGCLKGTALTFSRLARCHPLARGGLDPVPGHGVRKEI